jgi:type IV secretory pathway VirB10-like protein
MTMEETNRTFTDDEGEETMVSPRFDDEETVLARPVVPFEEVSDAPAATSASALPPLYSRLRAAPRRSLVAALVLISALVGSALGVAGLYFYQKHRADDAPATTEQQQADVPAPAAAQATPEPTPESQARETNAHAAEPSASAPVPAPTERDARAEGDAGSSKGNAREEADAAPVVERRNVSESRDPVVSSKHGKKGERDEEPRREARRENRDDVEDQPVRADDSGDGRREARRVGVITYRPRRVRTRRENYGDSDRLRRIFEGQP